MNVVKTMKQLRFFSGSQRPFELLQEMVCATAMRSFAIVRFADSG